MDGMKLEDRDQHIMRLIYSCGGILHKDQILKSHSPDGKLLFPSEGSLTKRLTEVLCKHNYLAKPRKIKTKTEDGKVVIDIDDCRDHKAPAAMGCYWLGWRGAVWFAQDQGHKIATPEEMNEAEQERLSKQLAKLGIVWNPEPDWSRIPHNLNVADIHITITLAVKDQLNLKIEDWINEGYFRLKPDKFIQYPDSYFAISDTTRHGQKTPYQAARFLLEVDKGGHPHNRLVEKFKAGLQFLQSSEFKKVSGANAGRYLFVTDRDESRINEARTRLKAELPDHAYFFLFTTFDQVKASNPLTDPIWVSAGSEAKQTLFEERK